MVVSQAPFRVHGVEEVAPGLFVLSFDRNGLEFETGQYVSLGIPGHRKEREYSIYSSETDPHLAVLIKVVPEGAISSKLVELKQGDLLHVSGPYGYFLLKPSLMAEVPLLWIATGSGVSPFHSFASTYPGSEYHLFHGTRTLSENALVRDFPRDRVVSCVSGEPGGDYHGRVTNYLSTWPIEKSTHVFLCGNCDMIYDAFDLLQAKGIPAAQILTEVYY
jgi:ferredoxin--NADP+ reductase/benzoate/toluate 1,2-dioxygenase reductase subunit